MKQFVVKLPKLISSKVQEGEESGGQETSIQCDPNNLEMIPMAVIKHGNDTKMDENGRMYSEADKAAEQNDQVKSLETKLTQNVSITKGLCETTDGVKVNLKSFRKKR